jgi:hypothetical protein
MTRGESSRLGRLAKCRMLECWAYCGLVSRMMLPLGLNVRSAELSLKSVMLPPPADAIEREERRITVWMAFYHETVDRKTKSRVAC